jgi:hypothetical protein
MRTKGCPKAGTEWKIFTRNQKKSGVILNPLPQQKSKGAPCIEQARF